MPVLPGSYGMQPALGFLDLDCCYKDSPPFQRSLFEHDRLITASEGLMRAVGRAARQVVEANDFLSRANFALADALHALGRFEADALKGQFDERSALVQLADRIRAIELDRKDFMHNFDFFVTGPLENQFKHEIQPLKENRKRYERTRLEFGHSYSKYMAKRWKDLGLAESAQEVASARFELHDASLDYAVGLNDAADRRATYVYQAAGINLLTCRLEQAESEVEHLKAVKLLIEETAKQNILSAEELNAKLLGAKQEKDRILNSMKSLYNPLMNLAVPTSESEFIHALISAKSLESMTAGGGHLPQRSGYLYKRSSHAVRPVWSRRYFCLQGDRLVYYSMDGTGEYGQAVPIELRLCHVRPANDPERRFCFDIVSPVKTYRLQTENEAEMKEWIETLKRGISLAFELNSSNRRKSVKDKSLSAATTEFGLTDETGHAELIQSILSLNQIEMSLTKAKQQSIKALPGNNVCSECRAQDPDWASLSYGVLFCISCSGIHRSLGVQVSKVKSLSLDFWEPTHVDLMLALGNQASWSIFEEQFDAPPINVQAPVSHKKEWILQKYVGKKYMKQYGHKAALQMLKEAVESCDTPMCLRGIVAGGNVDMKVEIDCEGRKVLIPIIHRAADLRHWPIVALLRVWGADPAASDSLGRNLIHHLAILATHSDSPASQVVSLLLSLLRRAPHLSIVPDKSGQSALQLAEALENAELTTIMRVFESQIPVGSNHAFINAADSESSSPSVSDAEGDVV